MTKPVAVGVQGRRGFVEVTLDDNATVKDALDAAEITVDLKEYYVAVDGQDAELDADVPSHTIVLVMRKFGRHHAPR